MTVAAAIQLILDDYGEISSNAWDKKYGADCSLAQTIQKALESEPSAASESAGKAPVCHQGQCYSSINGGSLCEQECVRPFKDVPLDELPNFGKHPRSQAAREASSAPSAVAKPDAVQVPKNLLYRLWGFLAQDCTPCAMEECQIGGKNMNVDSLVEEINALLDGKASVSTGATSEQENDMWQLATQVLLVPDATEAERAMAQHILRSATAAGSHPWERTSLPSEPTRAMLDAWSEEMRGYATHRPSTIWPGLHYSDSESRMVNAYQAMLSAAPPSALVSANEQRRKK